MKEFFKNRLFISGILCLLLATILIIVEMKFNLIIFLWNLTSNGWATILLIASIILFEILIIKALSSLKKRSKKSSFIIYTIALVFSFLLLSFFALRSLIFGFSGEPKYFVFDSPDKQHTIVVEEESLLLAGGGTIYEKVNALFMTCTDSYGTDDGYRPFSDNNYKLDWKEDSVTITFGFGEIDANGNEIKGKVKIDFTQ